MSRPLVDPLYWEQQLERNRQPNVQPVIPEADRLGAEGVTSNVQLAQRDSASAMNEANAYRARKEEEERQRQLEEERQRQEEMMNQLQQQVDSWYSDLQNQYKIQFDQQNQQQNWAFENANRNQQAFDYNTQQALSGAQGILNAQYPPFSSSSSTGQIRMAILQTAVQYQGLPYIWGGTDLSKGVDCSGLVQSVYKQFGVNLPRIANDQAHYGVRTSIGKLQPGDLVAWNNNMVSGQKVQGGVGHIAIYMGNGKIIESPQPGKSVQIRNLGKNENVFGVHLPNLNRG